MITRENYEEYFLLYTDNELSAAEKEGVEQFVTDHPDLREEWEALLQCRISPDTHLVFPGRPSLLKPESGSPAHTEELLLYLDGELDQAAAARAESLLRLDPQLAKEFAALQHTVSQPDPAIVYPRKSELYKKEKTRRIVAMPWVRVGVAASIAGAVALLFLLPGRQATPRTVASTTDRKSHPSSSQSTSVHHSSTAVVSAVGPAVAATHSRNLSPAVTFVATPPLHNRTRQQRTKEQRHPDVAINLPKDQVSAAASSNADPAGTLAARHPIVTIATSALAGNGTAGDLTAATGDANVATGDLAANLRPAAGAGIPREQSSFATQALLEEANEARNNSFISDEPAATGRVKLRGIFRKVTRVFEKTADRDGDGNRQILVGAFQVPLD